MAVPVLREAADDQSFDARFLDAPADCLLFGYFQSPLYFASIAGPLRAELNTLIGGAVSIPESLRTMLATASSVAVHVRRKDYLNLPIFQVCDSQYYQESMRQMRARLPAARFFIFSDDPDWCRAAFCEADQEVIDSGVAAANPLHDLHLMSLAAHHIIANSSYSWWAAWLGEKPPANRCSCRSAGTRMGSRHRWRRRDGRNDFTVCNVMIFQQVERSR